MKLKIIVFFLAFAIADGIRAELPWGTTTRLNDAELASEYVPYFVPGKNVLSGQAFLTQRGGGVVKAAGREVTLDPATSTGTEWWNLAGAKWAYRFEKHNSPNFLKARRVVIADADGRFTFKDIPAGKYYLRTDVTWEVGTEIQGGLVGRLIEVKEGEPTEVILNNLAQVATDRSVAAAQLSTRVHTLDEMLSSGIPQEMKEAADNIYKGKKFQPERLDLLHSIIEKSYKQSLSKEYIESVVALCQALAASGVVEHKPLIEDVAANAAEEKVRNKVKKYLSYYK